MSLIVFFACSKDSSSSSEIPEVAPVIQYTLTVSAQSGGSVNNEGGSYIEGSAFSVTATPDSDYEFTGWTGIESSENPLSINVNSNLTLQANFKKKTYPLTVNISGNGSVKEEIVSTNKSTNYEVGTIIRLTPIPIADETIFLKWAGDLTGNDSPVEITVDQPKTVTATFEFAVYNGVVGKWKVKKVKTGTSKNFEIDYVIFNSDFTYEVGLVDDADFNDTAIVTGTFDIISNEKIELYQVTVQAQYIAAGAVNDIKLDINNTISFELDLAPKTGDFVGTIKQTVDNASKDLNYDPVTKSTITQTTTSVTTTSTTSTNTTQSFTSTPTLTFPKFQSNVFNFCNNQPIPQDAVSWFIFYDPSSISSLTNQNAITNIEVSNLPSGINYNIENQPNDLNGNAQIAIKISGTPIDNSFGSYQVQISAVNGYTGLKESASFNVKIDSCTTTPTTTTTTPTTTSPSTPTTPTTTTPTTTSPSTPSTPTTTTPSTPTTTTSTNTTTSQNTGSNTNTSNPSGSISVTKVSGPDNQSAFIGFPIESVSYEIIGQTTALGVDNIPPGVLFTNNGGTIWELSGTPTSDAGGTYSFAVYASNGTVTQTVNGSITVSTSPVTSSTTTPTPTTVTSTPTNTSGTSTTTADSGTSTGTATVSTSPVTTPTTTPTPTTVTSTPTNTSGTSTTTADSGTSTGTADVAATTFNINVTASNSQDYTFSGDVGGNDPTINIKVGDTIVFNVNAPGHPFYLKTQAGVGTGDLVGGVTNNGTTNGSITFTPNEGVYYYQCSLHGGMFGSIIVSN